MSTEEGVERASAPGSARIEPGTAQAEPGTAQAEPGTAQAEPGTAQAEPGTAQAGTAEQRLHGWFAGRLPGDWFTGPIEVVLDREEISVIGTLPEAEEPGGASEAERSAAAEVRIRRFREQTRERRIQIAREAEHRFERKVSWGVRCGGKQAMFTSLSIPVMTRLRQGERRVLDTLVDAGVARSRSDALAWCARLVGKNADSWLADLREALRHVEQVRAHGPDR